MTRKKSDVDVFRAVGEWSLTYDVEVDRQTAAFFSAPMKLALAIPSLPLERASQTVCLAAVKLMEFGSNTFC